MLNSLLVSSFCGCTRMISCALQGPIVSCYVQIHLPPLLFPFYGTPCACMWTQFVQSGVTREQKVVDGVPQPVRAHRHLHFPAKHKCRKETAQGQAQVACACVGIDLGQAKPAAAVALALPTQFACRPQSRPWPSMPDTRTGRICTCACASGEHDKCLYAPHHPGRRQVRPLTDLSWCFPSPSCL